MTLVADPYHNDNYYEALQEVQRLREENTTLKNSMTVLRDDETKNYIADLEHNNRLLLKFVESCEIYMEEIEDKSLIVRDIAKEVKRKLK